MFLSYVQNPERTPVAEDEAKVRSTITVADGNAPPAVADEKPIFNGVDVDPDTDGGLTPHQVAPFITPTVKYVNPTLAEANVDHNAIVNDTISTSGTAASRESSGVWGHGTMQYSDSIEPLYSEQDLGMGDRYFDAERPEFGSADTGLGVQASSPGDPANKAAQSTAEQNARAAVQASQYNAFHHAMTGL